MIDVKIMAHPSRSRNVGAMLQSLGMSEDIVVWDDRENGGDAMYTARKAWTAPIPEGCTHRIVFQDDGDICDNFMAIAEKAAAKHPNTVVTFFHMGEMPKDERYQEYMLSVGVALMLPVKVIERWFDFVDNRIQNYCAKELLPDILKADTSCLRLFLRNAHIPCVTTVPTLVQHIGDNSLVGINRRRVAVDFEKYPTLSGW